MHVHLVSRMTADEPRLSLHFGRRSLRLQKPRLMLLRTAEGWLASSCPSHRQDLGPLRPGLRGLGVAGRLVPLVLRLGLPWS